MTARPFRIAIAGAQLDDLYRRLDAARLPASFNEARWEDGTSLDFMQRLAAYWRTGFDWRAQEARMNRFHHFTATIDGLDIHFIHERAKRPGATPLILTHGWPGSFVEMLGIIPLLTEDFDVVVPSLPGYGFSQAPLQSGVNSARIAELWHELMRELGYIRFAAQGGDIGASVSSWLARLFPASIIGVHLNYIPGGFAPPLGPDQPPVTPEEQAFLDTRTAWVATEGAYAALQSTKPQTLAYSLSDSPIGLAAWIAEKFRAWSDCGGEIERAVSLDELLTNISVYWFGGTIAASLRLYKENRLRRFTFEAGERISPPLGVAHFPKELPTPPRSWVERVYDVQRWTEMPRGGHFAALEQPELLAGDIRAFFEPLRTAALA